MLKITAKFTNAWNTTERFESSEEFIERIEERNNLLDKYCEEIGRDPKTLKRTIGIYEEDTIHNIGRMQIYENLELLEDAIKRLYEIGITEIFIVYPFKEEEIPSFEYFAEEMLPELKKRYS